MANNVQHKVIITGTGRAGTTLLMQLLTRLGLDTGYTQINEAIYESCHAGMERRLTADVTPYIIKSTHLSVQLEDILKTGKLKIDHAFIPIRNLHDAAASRIAISNQQKIDSAEALSVGRGVPGGLFYCYHPSQQEDTLARIFFQLMRTVVAADIPYTLLDFPRFARNPRYLYDKLQPLLGTFAYETFQAAFEDVVDLSLIHTFEKNLAESA